MEQSEREKERERDLSTRATFDDRSVRSLVRLVVVVAAIDSHALFASSFQVRAMLCILIRRFVLQCTKVK